MRSLLVLHIKRNCIFLSLSLFLPAMLVCCRHDFGVARELRMFSTVMKKIMNDLCSIKCIAGNWAFYETIEKPLFLIQLCFQWCAVNDKQINKKKNEKCDNYSVDANQFLANSLDLFIGFFFAIGKCCFSMRRRIRIIYWWLRATS